MFVTLNKSLEIHEGGALCCDISQDGKFVITGGLDDCSYLAKLTEEHEKSSFACLKHKESINALAFNSDSTFVASGDLAGTLIVYNLIERCIEQEFEVVEINWLKWMTKSYDKDIKIDYLLVGTDSGEIWMWNICNPSEVKIFTSGGYSTTAGEVLLNSNKFVCAYSDGTVRVYDSDTTAIIAKNIDSDQREIISLAVNQVGSLAAAGFIDSTVKLISTNNGKTISVVQCKTPLDILEKMNQEETIDASSSHHNELNQIDELDISDGNDVDDNLLEVEVEDMTQTENDDEDNEVKLDDEESDTDDLGDGDRQEITDSIESVMFSPCGRFLAAANISGSIYVWDISNMNVRHEKHSSRRISKCLWTQDNQIITGSLDGIVNVYDTSLKEIQEFAPHRSSILDMKYKLGILLTVSDDTTAKINELKNS